MLAESGPTGQEQVLATLRSSAICYICRMPVFSLFCDFSFRQLLAFLFTHFYSHISRKLNSVFVRWVYEGSAYESCWITHLLDATCTSPIMWLLSRHHLIGCRCCVIRVKYLCLSEPACRRTQVWLVLDRKALFTGSLHKWGHYPLLHPWSSAS